MFALAEVAAAHGSIQSSQAMALIGAVAIAAFWRTIVKVGIVFLGVLIVMTIVGGAAAVASLLHL